MRLESKVMKWVQTLTQLNLNFLKDSKGVIFLFCQIAHLTANVATKVNRKTPRKYVKITLLKSDTAHGIPSHPKLKAARIMYPSGSLSR